MMNLKRVGLAALALAPIMLGSALAGQAPGPAAVR